MKYKNTKTKRLLQKYGENQIRMIWEKLGYKKTAEYFNTTIAVIRRIVKDNQWKRSAAYTPNILRSLQKGTKTIEDFPHMTVDSSSSNRNSLNCTPIFVNDVIEIWVVDSVSKQSPEISSNNTQQVNNNSNSVNYE